MALAHFEALIQWAGADFKLVAGAGSDISDAYTLPSAAGATAFGELAIQGHAKHSGAPGNDDYVDLYLLASAGNVDGTAGDDFDTNDHAWFLMRLDTQADDPAIKTVTIPAAFKAFKIRAVNNAGENVTVRVVVHGTQA